MMLGHSQTSNSLIKISKKEVRKEPLFLYNKFMLNEKQELRKYCKSVRDRLDTDFLSKKIIDNLFSLEEFQKTLNVFSYISFGKEVDISRVLNLKEKNIFVPKLKNQEMIMCEYGVKNLEKNKYGIWEPIEEKVQSPQKNDVIIIPALAADKNFNRLGYGGGYYDKYLNNTNGVFVALVYDELIFSQIPVEKFDIKCDYIISEQVVLKKHY